MRRILTPLLFLAASVSFPSVLMAQSIQYAQDFDAVTIPELPPGWSAPESAWETSSSVPSPGSGGNNVENAGGDTGSLVSPVFDFSQVTTATLHYTARRTATYDSLSMSIEASIDGGATWSVTVVDSTTALPAPPSTYVTVDAGVPQAMLGETAVRFRFNALHATSGNLRVDDVELVADGPVSWNRFGFATDSSSGVEDTDSLLIPIGLHLIPSSVSLQGLQFSLVLTAGLSFLSLESTLPALNEPGWHVSYEAADSTISVVVLADGISGLAPVSTDSLLTMVVRPLPLDGASSRNDVIEIDAVIASAVSTTGEDLFLAVDPSIHQVAVLPRTPILSIDSTQVDIGTIREDSTAVVDLTLTNTGTGVLQVLDMFSISGLLQIDPAFATLEPDSSTVVSISVDGSAYGVGPLEDWLVIDHDGLTSPDTLMIFGSVIGADTRGDANGDGYVDVVDLVLGIDLILGRIDLPETKSRLDLHPFPGGNEAIDVRDLTVLAQAIARGSWPDGALLPLPSAAVSKAMSVVGDVIVRRTDEGLGLWVRSAEPLRALHVVGRLRDPNAVIRSNPELPQFAMGRPYGISGSDSFSILAFGMDEVLVPSVGTVRLATIDGATPEDLEIVSSMAVDGSTNRRNLLVIEETSEVPDDVVGISFGAPYPNPVDPRKTGLLHLPVETETGRACRIDVTDVLGRRVRSWDYTADLGSRVAAWDMRNAEGNMVPSGMYFLTVTSGNRRITHSVAVR